MDISDVGSTDSTALLCHTNYIRIGTHSGGDWFAPNGTRVKYDVVKGITRTRGSKVVRLWRTTTGPPPEGMYWCSILDAAYTVQTIFVGLYNSGQGLENSISVTDLLSIRHCLCLFNFICRAYHIVWCYDFHSKH